MGCLCNKYLFLGKLRVFYVGRIKVKYIDVNVAFMKKGEEIEINNVSC